MHVSPNAARVEPAHAGLDRAILGALRRLDDIVQDTAASSTLLHLQIRLRASADQMVRDANVLRSKRDLRLCCSMFFACVLHASAASPLPASSLQQIASSERLRGLKQRSERYIKFAEETAAHVIRTCASHFRLALRGDGLLGGQRYVLTHGSSSACVIELLKDTARALPVTLVVAEGSPDGEGHYTARQLLRCGVPDVRIVLYSSRC